MKRHAILAAAVMGLAGGAMADVKLASVFSDNMVLQRDQKVAVWGTADANAPVQVSFGGSSVNAVAGAEGKWKVEMGPFAADVRPQVLTAVAGDQKAVVNNVLVGDVWLCSGQSNMQMALHEPIGGPEYAARYGSNGRIRLLTVPKGFTDKVQTKQDGKWEVSSPEAAKKFSAVGFIFGTTLTQDPKLANVPIGLIDNSFGATVVEGWIPAEQLAKFDKKDIGNSMFGGPTHHYNAMVAPLMPMGLKGVIWYQGEGNSGRPQTYARFLTTMIESWRSGFENEKLPFIIVQLPSFTGQFGEFFYTWLREQETMVARDVPNVGLDVTYDTTDGSDLHPPEKIAVGERATLVARKLAYGEDIVATGPMFKSAAIDGTKVRVTFDTAGSELTTRDGSNVVRGFMLAGEDGAYRYATGRIDNSDTVILEAPGITAPKAVRFAWAGAPDANLTNRAALPAIPFRTDNFAPSDTELQKQPPARRIETGAYEVVISSRGKITSLGVNGQQFISNNLGSGGGTIIPGWLGPREFSKSREAGPGMIEFYDNELSLQMTFQASGMQWHLENNGKDEITFNLNLATEVNAEGTAPAVLTRGGSKLTAEGFTALQGHTLSVKVPGHSSRTLKLTVSK